MLSDFGKALIWAVVFTVVMGGSYLGYQKWEENKRIERAERAELEAAKKDVEEFTKATDAARQNNSGQ